MLNALSGDWREEVSPGLISALRGVCDTADQIPMFSDQRHPELDRLARESVGRPLALSLIECADRAMVAGLHGPAALEDAARRALDLRVCRGFRQMEEHYLRESNERRAYQLRQNLDAAASASDLGAWARRLTGIETGSRTAPQQKMDGIDDGAPL
ncbi:hypothetical protein [Hyphomicrobium sp.]|uniref:hypothetical protein n=1 Tax=Hyphomicrobium sp. TaxID=82 RepID=UPI0025C14E30|nr:hypothetical protein [Hyphomicrobium sp.]